MSSSMSSFNESAEQLAGQMTLLEHLEELDAQDVYEKSQVRFPVQTVIRPKKDEFHDFRGYAGKLYGGDLSVGDEVTVLPSLTTSKVKEIFFFDQKFDTAGRGSSCTITLEDDVNVSRGDMIVKSSEKPRVEKQLIATVCWMDSKDLNPGTNYFVQSGSNRILAKVKSVSGSIATDFSGEDTVEDWILVRVFPEGSVQEELDTMCRVCAAECAFWLAPCSLAKAVC